MAEEGKTETQVFVRKKKRDIEKEKEKEREGGTVPSDRTEEFAKSSVSAKPEQEVEKQTEEKQDYEVEQGRAERRRFPKKFREFRGKHQFDKGRFQRYQKDERELIPGRHLGEVEGESRKATSEGEFFPQETDLREKSVESETFSVTEREGPSERKEYKKADERKEYRKREYLRREKYERSDDFKEREESKRVSEEEEKGEEEGIRETTSFSSAEEGKAVQESADEMNLARREELAEEGFEDKQGISPSGAEHRREERERFVRRKDERKRFGQQGRPTTDFHKRKGEFREWRYRDEGKPAGEFDRERGGEIEIYSGEGVISTIRPRRVFHKRKKWRKEMEKEVQKPPPEPAQPKKIKIPEAIRVADLSKLTGIKASEIIAKLLELGKEVTINHLISAEEAELVCSEFNIQVEKEEFDETKYFDLSPDPEEKLKPRPPVIVVMGHVDHGKTTLLDAIRETNIAEKEIGGITQSIGAYTVEVNGKSITFIDTPGHEAFTEMRARGSKVADIAVLVVAADEGVKPQTIEAINHARAAELPIVVAINKIDKPGANPEKVKRELSEFGLIPDDWGGDTLFAEISAKRRIGIDDLLEKILIQAELLDLKANPDRPAEGVVIESGVDKGLGAVATVIIQRGTLKKGDIVVCGLTWGKVRNIFSDKGKVLKEVYPGFPAKVVIGGEDIPVAGDKLYVVQSEEIAQKIVEERKRREAKPSGISLEEIFERISQFGEKFILPVVLKANTQGALDALEKEINEIKAPEIEIKIVHKGIGVISKSDVNLAAASRGIVVGYNVNVDKQAQNLAKMHGVQIRLYKIIYDIIDDIKKAIRGMLKPREVEVVVGTAKVLKLFKLSVGKVLGCFVENGKVQLGLPARVKRDGQIIGEGKIVSLKRFKDSVNEVKEGEECGIIIEGVSDAKENDIIECYQIVKEEIKI